jgi:hypothetical protein
MVEDPEMIRTQMQQTRASLTEKLEALEHQVVHTVQEATCAVAETVDTIKEAAQDTVGTVKETVHDTVETVREAFDVKLQFQRRPWVMFGGSVVLGYLAGNMAARNPVRRASRFSVSSAADREPDRRNEFVEASAPPARNGVGHKLREAIEPELDKFKALAIGALLGVVRDAAATAFQGEVGDQLREAFDHVTERLGGQTFKHPILSEENAAAPPSRAAGIRRF